MLGPHGSKLESVFVILLSDFLIVTKPIRRSSFASAKIAISKTEPLTVVDDPLPINEMRVVDVPDEHVCDQTSMKQMQFTKFFIQVKAAFTAMTVNAFGRATAFHTFRAHSEVEKQDWIRSIRLAP